MTIKDRLRILNQDMIRVIASQKVTLDNFCKYFHIDPKYQKCKSIPAVRRHQCEVEKTINILGPCRWFLPPGTVKLASRELWRAGKQGVAKKVAKI